MMGTGHLKLLFLLIFAILVISPVLITPSRADPAPRTGHGLLLAYTDEARKSLVPSDDDGNYSVGPNTKYYFNITGINEFKNPTNPTKIYVLADYSYGATEYEDFVGKFQIDNVRSDISFEWTIPNLPVKPQPHTISIKMRYLQPYPGDVDLDGDVNTQDLTLLNKAYCSTQGDARWEPKCDFNDDNHVDVNDLFILGRNFGLKHTLEWYWARGLDMTPRLLLVIPEVPLGGLGVIAALFLGFKLRTFIKRKNKPQLVRLPITK